MARKLKVFGGVIHYGKPRTQVRTIVGTYTKKQAVELLSKIDITGTISMYEFNNHWCETGNSIELSTANEVGVWVSKDRFEKNFKKIL